MTEARVDLRDGDWLDDNRANWDERVPVHVASTFYDRARLREGGSVLDPIARAGVERLFPDGLDGVRVLHLQCHFGSDTLSLVNAGATAVGLDFSEPAVVEARRMADELGVADRTRFVQANIYDARHVLPEPESFDLVFTTWGTIGWLPDVAEWARIIEWFLAPGGRLYFADGHPAAFVFDGDGGPDGMPQFAYPYAAGRPEVIDDPSDYADPDARIQHARTWEWMHPLDEVLRALRDAGLRIDSFTEHYEVPWQIFPVTVPRGDGMYGWPDRRWLPLSYEVVAATPRTRAGE
ncbi:bifunctional 2-polyprenyl-6-hydroxyphenol methylase/3-demethylubiquinol 3-O-methyltransferase UbiG [Agromyces sp. C10]|uniref:class I SAM-dependent methyltransferase n=1 Tax=Agromyces sp. C10 TaxID=2935077 RepID=UPI00200B3FC8|nr:class I SAM-dependent methyltransferase [Agromyces sp. C10]MCK8608940.1 class I SAM-dependent methyltransferase [Agromyces sp. C10]